MTEAPHLKRELNLYDLTLLLVVAVVNINVLPQLCAEGWRAVSLWVLGFLSFLIPLAIAVEEFGKRYPEEGGIYIWTRKEFGEFHAFISGWCYWTNNLFYIPSVLFITVGVLTYLGGQEAAPLAENPMFMTVASVALLWFITLLHIRGLSAGKWLNNMGGISIWVTLFLLLGIALLMISRTGKAATPLDTATLFPSFRSRAGLSAFSIALYSLVGLELGSVMGDEIKNVRDTVRKAVWLAAVITVLLYIIGTASLLIAVPSKDVVAIQGLMQAVTVAANTLDLRFLIPVIAVVIGIAITGICSAWLAGSARIPFVMGVEAYLPKKIGLTHPRWKSPYVALLVQGIVSTIFILISLHGTNVLKAYDVLLKCSIVIQLVPFLYLFAGLLKLRVKRLAGFLGLISTIFGIIFVFFPTTDEDIFQFRVKVVVGTVFMLGLAYVFYATGRRKAR